MVVKETHGMWKIKLTYINSTASVKNVKPSNKIPCKIFWAYGIAICVYVQGRSKVFTTGQARFNPEHYVIKCVGGR